MDQFNYYPPSHGNGILGFDPSQGWLMLDDWKEALIPYVGVQGDNFADKPATMRTLRCPQLVSNSDGKRANGQYAYNASGTAPHQSPANLGLGGYQERQFLPTAESRVRVPSNLIANPIQKRGDGRRRSKESVGKPLLIAELQ